MYVSYLHRLKNTDLKKKLDHLIGADVWLMKMNRFFVFCLEVEELLPRLCCSTVFEPLQKDKQGS